MKLSFSTNGWTGFSFDDYCDIAKELRFYGIELHDISNKVFSGEKGALTEANIKRTKTDLAQRELCIPCIDSTCNLAQKDNKKENITIIEHCIQTANSLSCPYVRLYATDTANDKKEQDEAVIDIIKNVLPTAKKAGVVLLIESAGLYADTKRLCDVLNEFADDNLCALWDIFHTCAQNETPQETITNLGEYVKHVHIKDAYKENGKVCYCLMGEGSLPIADAVNALRSVNYNGFISLELNPKWMDEDLADADIVFPHFVSYMRRFDDPSRNKTPLYDNRAKTGKYVWKKDTLIDCTFSQVLDRMVEEFPDQYAFKYTTLDYDRTYSEFRDDVDSFSKTLISLGVKAGDKITIWATNVPQWYIAFWAAAKIGAILVTMNTAYKIHEAEYLLKQSDTNILVMIKGFRDSKYDEIINELCPEIAENKQKKELHCKRLPFLRHVITADFEMKGCLSWNEALEKGKNVPIEQVHRMASAVSSKDVCNMQYTSGTTGFPKGVMLTHYGVVNNGKCIGDRMDLSTADRMMIHVPMFHCFGMVLAMTATMTHAGTIYPLPYFSAKPSLMCINTEHITCFHGVPTMFISMLAHKDFAKTDFSYMRTGIMAGSPCPMPVMKEVVEKMHMNEIVIVYGQTESSPGCTMSSTDDPLDMRVSTVGRAMPEIECKIVDPETGEDCPDNVIGEFVARGYNIMKGYYKMPTATAEAIDKDGWLHTGDLACRKPDGYYRITGRLKDMIIRGGENIYPKEIEEFIYTHPKVSDVQVIGVPDERSGEEIMACVILKQGEALSADELKKYVAEHMAHHKIPKYVEFMDEFPTNVAGKILKYKMREDAVKKLGL